MTQKTKHHQSQSQPQPDRRITLLLDEHVDNLLIGHSIERQRALGDVIEEALIAYLTPQPWAIQIPPELAREIAALVAGSGVSVQQFIVANINMVVRDAKTDADWRCAVLEEAIFAGGTHV